MASEKDVNRIIAGMNKAENAADFVNTMVFEAQQIEGTRYKYVFTNAEDPRD